MKKNHLEIPNSARRDFMKWTLGMGAALGLKPWKIFEATESVVGPAMADQMSCAPVNRFIGNVMGNGGIAWMTQFWPHTAFTSKDSPNTSFYAPGSATAQALRSSGDAPLMLGPAAPFQSAGKSISAFLSGSVGGHTDTPSTALALNGSTSLFDAIAAVQQLGSPTLVPAISISQLPYGAAPGAPSLTTVSAGTNFSDLFASAASKAGGALANPANATLFDAYYKANVTLQAAAGRATRTTAFQTGRVAANLLGTNLASQLKPTPEDYARYGVDANTAGNLATIAGTLITTFKAFRHNLTNMVLQPGMQDDPHKAFADANASKISTQTIIQLGKIWDAFMGDMMSEPDPTCAGAKMGDNLIVTWTGDQPKRPALGSANDWSDDAPANHLYVLGNDWITGGWHGAVRGDLSVQLWDPTTGQSISGGNVDALAKSASAAVLYAVTKGDIAKVKDFYNGPDIGGITAKKSM